MIQNVLNARAAAYNDLINAAAAYIDSKNYLNKKCNDNLVSIYLQIKRFECGLLTEEEFCEFFTNKPPLLPSSILCDLIIPISRFPLICGLNSEVFVKKAIYVQDSNQVKFEIEKKLSGLCPGYLEYKETEDIEGLTFHTRVTWPLVNNIFISQLTFLAYQNGQSQGIPITIDLNPFNADSQFLDAPLDYQDLLYSGTNSAAFVQTLQNYTTNYLLSMGYESDHSFSISGNNIILISRPKINSTTSFAGIHPSQGQAVALTSLASSPIVGSKSINFNTLDLDIPLYNSLPSFHSKCPVNTVHDTSLAFAYLAFTIASPVQIIQSNFVSDLNFLISSDKKKFSSSCNKFVYTPLINTALDIEMVRWFKDNILISDKLILNSPESGNYRLDVLFSNGCLIQTGVTVP